MKTSLREIIDLRSLQPMPVSTRPIPRVYGVEHYMVTDIVLDSSPQGNEAVVIVVRLKDEVQNKLKKSHIEFDATQCVFLFKNDSQEISPLQWQEIYRRVRELFINSKNTTLSSFEELLKKLEIEFG